MSLPASTELPADSGHSPPETHGSCPGVRAAAEGVSGTAEAPGTAEGPVNAPCPGCVDGPAQSPGLGPVSSLLALKELLAGRSPELPHPQGSWQGVSDPHVTLLGNVPRRPGPSPASTPSARGRPTPRAPGPPGEFLLRGLGQPKSPPHQPASRTPTMSLPSSRTTQGAPLPKATSRLWACGSLEFHQPVKSCV